MAEAPTETDLAAAGGPLARLGHHAHKWTGREESALEELCEAFEDSALSLGQRLQAFPRHVRRQDVARFLTRYELFKLVLPVAGSIVECGVFTGGGLMSWSHFSAILEPYNHTRRVIGFDTFAGFPDVHDKDEGGRASELLREGALATHAGIEGEILQLAAAHDRNRPLGHIPKIELVPGDAVETIPRYVEDHKHLLISLLYLDFDIYEPTRVALDHLLGRVVTGGVVAFDELNTPEFPGETLAMLETADLRRDQLRRFPLDPSIAYVVKT